MLKDHASSAIVGVADVDRARAFYRDVLGLDLVDDSDDGPVVFATGATRLMVYPSEYAGTNKANAVAWSVGEAIEEIVADLSAKGVTFDHYPMDDTTFEGGIHRMGDFRMVWFKDPDGNILHINSGA